MSSLRVRIAGVLRGAEVQKPLAMGRKFTPGSESHSVASELSEAERASGFQFVKGEYSAAAIYEVL